MDEKDVKILLVEDEEAVASFVKTELEFEGYQVVWAQDGNRAFSKRATYSDSARLDASCI